MDIVTDQEFHIINENKKNENDVENLQLLDLNGIHWGYLNCWQSVIRGKKSKVDSWYTFWVDLCGNTMRLYKDKSLPPDSVNMPPRASIIGPAPENEQKFAFFGLKDATVEVMSDLNLYPKKLKPADFTRIFRRHLFQIILTKLNSTYVFQAPSNSSMLRWVSKIQEGIAISENEQLSSADQQAKFANFVLQQRRLKTSENISVNKQKPDVSEEEEEMRLPVAQNVAASQDPRMKELQHVNEFFCHVIIHQGSPINRTISKHHNPVHDILKEKIALYNQLCLQEQQFLGGESQQEIRGSKSVGTAIQDYYLVPGRIETFICKGVKMTLFGQLPNKRWRCWIEIDDVIKAMNSLIAESTCEDVEKSRDEDSNNNGEAKTSLLERNQKVFQTMSAKDISNRGYPIVGAVPTSLIAEFRVLDKINDEQKKNENIFVSVTPPATSPTEELVSSDDRNDGNEGQSIPGPYSSHSRRKPRKSNSQLSFDSFFFTTTDDMKSESQQYGSLPRPKNKPASGSSPRLQTSPFYQNEIKKKFDNQEQSRANNEPRLSMPSPEPIMQQEPVLFSGTGVKMRENGFVIKKRLRQKGISIIVGSSSSDDDSDKDDSNEETEKRKRTKIADELLKQAGTEHWERTPEEDKRYSLQETSQGIQPFNNESETRNENERQFASHSANTLPGKFTANTELLDQFGLRSASIGNTEAAKLFPKLKGPDVKPPRNERRTLKLSKNADKGFGFYLQTFVFTQTNGVKDRKTFVRYVEEEGPAYMSGLREGDVIVEIDGEDMEGKDHAQLVNIIKNSERELLMVVKFIDAMRRAELCIKLKKKNAKLRSRLREYEELSAKENDFQRISSAECISMKRSDSTTSSGIGLSDDSSDNLTSSNEQVVIQTSRFEERCSTVFDSVKEIRYADDSSAPTNAARTHITTSFDMLSAFSTGVQLQQMQTKKSTPVHRSRSFSGSGSTEEQSTSSKRNTKNSKDDAFITGVASLTKSRPPAKIVSNRNALPDNPQQLQLAKKLESQDQIFYNPSKERSTLPVKSRPVVAKKDRVSALPVKEYTPGRSGTLSNPSRDRILSRNSRPKSYKIAVTSGAEGTRKCVEKVVSYDQAKSRGTPETDL